MTDGAKELPLVVTRILRASRQVVFDAFVIPELRRLWWFPERGMHCDACEIDARPGGKYLVSMRNPEIDKSFVCTGKFLELVPPERLVFTWVWDHERKPRVPPEEFTTQVTVELADVDGGTELRILHERFHRPAERDGYAQGWLGCLDSLERVLDDGMGTSQ